MSDSFSLFPVYRIVLHILDTSVTKHIKVVSIENCQKKMTVAKLDQCSVDPELVKPKYVCEAVVFFQIFKNLFTFSAV